MVALRPGRRFVRAVLGAAPLFAFGAGWLALSPLAASTRSVEPAPAPDDACRSLGSRLCAELGRASDACAIAERKLAASSEGRCRAMAARFGEVVTELSDLAVAAREVKSREQRLPHFAAPSVGPADAPLTLVELADFENEDSGRAAPMARLVGRMFPGRVRIVFRQFPLPDHPQATLPAEASLAAHAQGKFWEYHDVLFANPHDLGRAALERYAAVVGLDLAEFRSALDTHRYAEDVRADVALGRALQVPRAPSLFANGEPVAVPYGVADLTALVEKELAKAQ